MARRRDKGIETPSVRVVRPVPFGARDGSNRRDPYGLAVLIALGVGLAVALVVALNTGHDVESVHRGSRLVTAGDPTTLGGAERLALAGQTMTKTHAEALEEQLAGGGGGLAARTRLLGYYASRLHEPASRERLEAHVRWLVDHEPGAPVLATAYARGLWEDATWAELRAAMLRHLTGEPSVPVVRNAARLIGERDLRTAEEILLRGQILEPDDAAWSQLRGMLELEAHTKALDPPRAPAPDDVLRKALAALDEAVRLKPNGPVPFSLLGDAAARAYRRGHTAMAKSYAEEALRQAPSQRDHWARGEVVHIAHTVLGLLAVDAGDLKAAARHLTKSADIPGSPRLGRRGPETALAKALLAKGQEGAVLAYLSATARFWPAGRDSGAIARWRASIRDGDTPDFATP